MIQVCIDFHDFNITCLKDEFLLSITDCMIDNTCSFERMFFMDGFSEYNQIKKYLNDESIRHSEDHWVYGNIIWLEEHKCNLPTCNEHNLP